ncbi:hypothetical protein Glove_300g107 [Diversispora epigaea]|uniref:TLDc domain-containing protein n=1 Tax=Diversispora epigaea TaxID=1348612 RepID=A0A397HWM0_9GLOM|nr:hypothetical protein Glove_300g107 [Diversispora epigaea]
MFPNKPFKSIVLPREWTILNHNQQRTCTCRRTFDRKPTTYSLSNIPEFQLILRGGSRDGFRPKTFWEMCIGHAGTIALAKVSGYNPLAWDNSTNNIYIETNDKYRWSMTEFMMKSMKSEVSNFTQDKFCWCLDVLIMKNLLEQLMNFFSMKYLKIPICRTVKSNNHYSF